MQFVDARQLEIVLELHRYDSRIALGDERFRRYRDTKTNDAALDRNCGTRVDGLSSKVSFEGSPQRDANCRSEKLTRGDVWDMFLRSPSDDDFLSDDANFTASNFISIERSLSIKSSYSSTPVNESLLTDEHTTSQMPLCFFKETVPESGQKKSAGEIKDDNASQLGTSTSIISQIFDRADSKSSGCEGANLARSFSDKSKGQLIAVTLYLPDKSNITVSVVPTCTLSRLLHRAIMKYQCVHELPILNLQDKMYEFRFVEDDKTPNMDLPTLDENQIVENFVAASDDSELELCVCVKAGQNSLESSSKGKTETTADQKAEKIRKRILTVYFPDSMSKLSVSKDQYPDGLITFKLLSMVQMKARLPLLAEEYQFVVTEEERERLSLKSEIVPMNANLVALDIREVRLRRKVYADAPRKQEKREVLPQTSRGDSNATFLQKNFQDKVVDRIHPSKKEAASRGTVSRALIPEEALKRADKAKVYQEWKVEKINRWGNRSRRILSMDGQEICVKRSSKFLPGPGFVPASWSSVYPLKSINLVQVSVHHPSHIRIVWTSEVRNSSNFLTYVVEDGPQAAIDIVEKFRQLTMSRENLSNLGIG